MSIYRLPLGQYGNGGHILNLPQDVTFINSFPRSVATLDVIIDRKQSIILYTIIIPQITQVEVYYKLH